METERLRIHELSEQHDAFILTLVNTEGWLRFIGQRNVHNIPDAQAYIQKINSNPKLKYFVIEQKDINTNIGLVTMIQRVYLPDPDFGFAFLPEFQNNGFAYEACQALLKYLHNTYCVQKMLAITLTSNIKSQNLLHKLGFVFEDKIMQDGDELWMYACIF